MALAAASLLSAVLAAFLLFHAGIQRVARPHSADESTGDLEQGVPR
jgi:hypothetical protein